MNIAIHAAELERSRIDGTSNYIAHTLRAWASTGTTDHSFTLYHRKREFNPAFSVPLGGTFQEKKIPALPLWTQGVFALSLYRDAPDVLWVPLHNLPRFRSPKTKTVVTIHDLAFKRYPETFPEVDKRKHDLQTAYALECADKVIAVSHSTKSDILKYYPDTAKAKIEVIHHGIQQEQWECEGVGISSVADKFNIKSPYIIYVGAIQPRKNIERLIGAFEKAKESHGDLQLVLLGGRAWLSDSIYERRDRSKYKNDIIMTGGLPFDEMKSLMCGAKLFAYPSLYEGFGLPILEAFAAGIPVLTADNSSLPEVAGGAAELCNAESVDDIARGIHKILGDASYAESLVGAGHERMRDFSWEKSANETLAALTSW